MIKRILPALLLFFTFTCVGSADSVMDTIKLKYAKDFKIEYLKDGYKVVTDAQGTAMLLVPKDKKDKDIPKDYKDLIRIEIPLERMICTSTTQVGLLRAFDDEKIYDSIVGVRQSVEDWDLDAIKKRMYSGRIKDIGAASEHSTIYDYEIIRSLKPAVVFTEYGMSAEQVNLAKMLSGAKIPHLLDGSSREEDYRGTLEWIKFYAAFYDMEQEAEEYFDAAIARIDAVTGKVEGAPRPKAAIGIVTMGKVYVENGNSKAARMLKDTGADYIFDDIGRNTQGITNISAEEFFARLSRGGIYIDRGLPKYGATKKSITDQFPVLASLPCFKENLVWKVSDNFWSSYHDIDRKYLEMAAIFHPDLFPDVEFEHFIHLTD